MTRLLLIRHGQSANNAQPEEKRVSDPALTELGVRQASATAKRLRDEAVTHIYCSPFMRALETARPIAESVGLPVQVRADIFEQGGCYSGYLAVGRRGEPGLGKTQIRDRYPTWRLDPSISDAGWWGRDYETWEEARTRAESVADWIATDIASQPGTHAMVIHADFKGLLIEALLNRSSTRAADISNGQSKNQSLAAGPLKNTGVTEFQYTRPAWALQSLNCVQHLDVDLVTH